MPLVLNVENVENIGERERERKYPIYIPLYTNKMTNILK